MPAEPSNAPDFHAPSHGQPGEGPSPRERLGAAVTLGCGALVLGFLMHRLQRGPASRRAVSRGPSLTAPRSGEGPRRSLILTGGGMRAAWQAGAMRALADAGITFQHADGTSTGILNLAMLLSGLSPQEVCERWRTLDTREFLPFISPDVEAPGGPEGQVERVLARLGVSVRAIRASKRLEGTFNVCDFLRKTRKAVPHTRVDEELLVAGLSPPGLLPPVSKDGTLYMDALWVQGANLLEAVRRGSERIWVLWCIGNTPTYERGFFSQYSRLAELAANGALFEQLDRIRELNERILAGEEVMGHRTPIVVHLVKPERPLPLDADFGAGRASAASLIDMGYSDAWRYLDVRGERGLPLTPEMTRTTEPAPELTFVESMTGPLALGATDPRAGALMQGARPFTLHGTISVDDVGDFVSDLRHSARLVARISYAPFGSDLPVRQGSFNVFPSAEGPGTRLMTYGLRFAARGREYFLEGTRAIRAGAGPHLWKDATRLYCQLHEGPTARGPVVGAGVLSLGVGQLLQLISSMSPARRGAAGLSSMERFGRFFLGPLWERYAPRASPVLQERLSQEVPSWPRPVSPE